MALAFVQYFVDIDRLRIYYGELEKTSTHTGMMDTVFRINKKS